MPARVTQLFASLLIGAALLAGCSGAPQAQAPTSAPAPTAAAPAATSAPAAPAATSAPSEGEIKAGIQQTLDVYSKAFNDNNLELLKQTVDQTNPPFRRLVEGRFTLAQESLRGGSIGELKVTSITQRDFGFVQANVLTVGGTVYDWLFRQVKGNWVLSEPTEKQLGAKEKIESDHFTFSTYPWADDVNQQLTTIMERARSRVLEKLGKVPDQKVNVIIRPIFGIGTQDPGALAYYDKQRGSPRMVIYAPHSYAFSAYDPTSGWEAQLETILTHEFTHLTNDNGLTPVALSKLSDWMTEGLAVYVSEDTRYDLSVRAAVQTDQVVPIVDTSSIQHPQDLEHLTLLDKNVGLGYGLGKSLILYMAEKYGGLDAFWKYAQAYSGEQKVAPALQKAFGVSYEQFDHDWRAWLKAKYS